MEKTIAVQKLRDIFKNASIKYTGKSYVVLIGVENQSDIHYSIPVKNMFYDVMAYGNQVKETAKKHRKEKDTATSDEFLSGFTKEDKLIPVITITVYLGTKEWDGPRKLSDMFGDVDEELLPFIPDYRINLLAPREITDFTGFRTSIRQLFEVLQNAYDKEKMQEVLQNDEKFSNVDRETVEAINLFAGTDIDIDEKEEVIDMCKAWEEQKNEGREEGRELGERQKIISQIVKKLQKDKSVAEIADDLEEKEEVIAPIYEAALSMKPDYDAEKLYFVFLLILPLPLSFFCSSPCLTHINHLFFLIYVYIRSCKQVDCLNRLSVYIAKLFIILQHFLHLFLIIRILQYLEKLPDGCPESCKVCYLPRCQQINSVIRYEWQKFFIHITKQYPTASLDHPIPLFRDTL